MAEQGTVTIRVTLELLVKRPSEREVYGMARRAIKQVCEDALPLLPCWSQVEDWQLLDTIYSLPEPSEPPEFPYGEFPNYYELKHDMTQEAVENYRQPGDE